MKTHDALGRRSRFVNQPIEDASYLIVPRDLQVLTLLQRFRYLPSHYVPALLGWSGQYHQDILHKLRHRAGLIHVPERSWPPINGHARHAVYGLTRKGHELLKERGLSIEKRRPRSKNDDDKLNHELGVALIQASFELGAREHSLQYISAQDILNHSACPWKTRQLKEPFVLHTTFNYKSPKGKEHTIEKEVETDGEFFGLARAHENGRTTFIIPGFEFDRRTETLEPEDYDRPFIAGKFLAFRELACASAYEERFGFPKGSYLIPFVTIGTAHMRSMMALLERLTNGRGSKLFLFKSIPNFAAFENFPKPTGHMLTELWERVGHPPLNILEALTQRCT
jgi:hypothetical protein